MSKMQKKGEGRRLRFEIRGVENYPNFNKSVLVQTGPGLDLLRGQDVLRGKIVVLMEKSQNTYKGKTKVPLFLSYEPMI